MELKANELRIGNWINYKGDHIQVTMVGRYGIQSSNEEMIINAKFSTPDLTGIPLSPEILEKAGFKLLKGTKHVYVIQCEAFEMSVSVDLNYLYIDTDWGQASIKERICQYVHQLQNIFHALTQTELNINL